MHHEESLHHSGHSDYGPAHNRMTSCSTSTTNSDTLLTGNNNDEGYNWVQSEVFSDQVYAGIDVSLEVSSSFIDSIPGATATRRHLVAESAVDGDVVITSWSYSFGNDWHHF